jgi:AraC family transcriptional regulator of adaptative response / DNA-3-methyladenine glycosylase II
MTDIAFASGFSSVRRFNDAFVQRYRMAPSHLRKTATDGALTAAESATSKLQLAYRPPYDWTGVLAFLGARALTGVEDVSGDAYLRTVQLGTAKGWIRVTHAPGRQALLVEFTHTLTPVLPALLSRVRALFDLDARPDVIVKRLARDPRLVRAVRANPGLRVPGAFNGFELGLRAILGQQVTVKAATTIAGRLMGAFGEPLASPMGALTHFTPSAAGLAKASVDDIARHGIVAARARSIIALAAAHDSGDLCLDGTAHHDPVRAIARLEELPGIGPWTAQYVAMRAMRWPDAFPKEDIAIRNSLGGVTARQAEALSDSWRPWRSYAVMHLWRMSGASIDNQIRRGTA